MRWVGHVARKREMIIVFLEYFEYLEHLEPVQSSPHCACIPRTNILIDVPKDLFKT
jgi:hypothetical protein